MASFSKEEIQQQLLNLSKTLEKKKKEADKVLSEIEQICRQILALQDMNKPPEENGQNSD